MHKILEWKTLRDSLLQKISEEIIHLKRPPKLCVILVGENSASQTYVWAKKKACESVGMEFEMKKLSESVTEEELQDIILEINQNNSIDGCIVQLPLPGNIRSQIVINSLDPLKDVDGFTRVNIGKLFLWEKDGHISCTPKWILRLLEHYNIPLSWKHAVILGRSAIVGRPLGLLLQHAGATVTTCHSRTEEMEKHIRQADILISAVGKPGLISASMISPGCVVIDVGMNRDTSNKLVWDVLFEEVIQVADCTPVPGGVGPMTIAMILENTLNAYRKMHSEG